MRTRIHPAKLAVFIIRILMFAMMIWMCAKVARLSNEPPSPAPCECVTPDANKVWDTAVIAAFIEVESGGNAQAVGEDNDVGVLQITPVVVWECNRLLGEDIYTLDDRYDPAKSIEMFNVIQSHKNPTHDLHLACKVWNPLAPITYHTQVYEAFKARM